MEQVSEKQEVGFLEVNKILSDTLKRAAFYFGQHDPGFRQYSLQLSAWQAFDDLLEVENRLSKDVRQIVSEFLRECGEAGRSAKNVQSPRFPIALEALKELSRGMDSVTRFRPWIRLKVPDNDYLVTFGQIRAFEKELRKLL